MARQSGTSHAAAALAAMVVGRMLVTRLEPSFPYVFRSIEHSGRQAQVVLASTTGVAVTVESFTFVFVVLSLAFVWGVLYHWMRHDS